ncbi:MAG: potassium-transporting ATPase subunit KdpC [Solirubrobacteraceae bacterium]
MRSNLRAALVGVVLFTVLLGLVYPLAVTGISQVVMPGKANGSQIERNGTTVGSELIGQDFGGDVRYFQSRPSATEYSADATFFNNLGPNQQELADQLTAAATAYAEREGVAVRDIPPDAVTTSASGVDPHISPDNAEMQARRVARERGLSVDRVNDLMDEHTAGRALGFMGEPGVNVLTLNLALDEETR